MYNKDYYENLVKEKKITYKTSYNLFKKIIRSFNMSVVDRVARTILSLSGIALCVYLVHIDKIVGERL